ncbi:Cof-type HAD-IIB family hydrolase [Candidatus Xianfuyuplasma coldseepsis]|uniref:HAD family phosphatase n=1 Tax=Candidatus Xianfuyuplasma coldseepsis TaxID=2782163 RepID=A0A7L7KTL2_9MOLU|nr:Cof-type HAD-IIB family hydrolase [Xianfuyuplasma coldseepsis]QMS85759.1 HAD family phosphatase [Xianfuyuplasma coldseepsis]
MTKMVVADMDGTLLRSDLSVSDKNKQAIEYLRNKGIHFTVATGRPDQLVKEYIELLSLNEPLIMYNGSVVGHPFQEKRLYEQSLAKEDVRRIVEYCEQENIIWMCYTKDKIISKPNFRVDFFLERNQKLPENGRSIFEDIRDIDTIVNDYHVQKILLIEHNQDVYKKTKTLLEQYDQFTIATSQSGFLDINPIGVTKGEALKKLAEHYHIALEDVVVFGDQENDISMLQIAGTSIAMGNATAHAKDVADYVTSTNNEDGFAQWVFANL